MKQFYGRMRLGALALPLLAVLFLAPAAHAAEAVTDTRVADRVEDELAGDPAVPADLIDVSSRDGIVALGGTVGNVLAVERAVRVAETVRGVRGVVSTLAVRPSPARTDRAIATDVRQAFIDDRATEAYAIDVAVKDNVVTLTGEADSWQEKRLAGKVARGVRGVTGVNNLIEVAADAARPDADIEAEIENALRWNALVDDALIQVQVEDGRVTLTGTVGSAAEKSRAVRGAYTAGVKAVAAEGLEVRQEAPRPELRGDKYADVGDADIRAAVADALAMAPRVPEGAVDPQVDDRVVTLRGTVDSLKAKRAAEWVARHIVGVQGVENRLKVRPGDADDAGGDQSLEKRVTDALQRDPYVQSRGISVSASDGAVSLYGRVPNYYEKAHAEDVASRLKGVIAVKNHLVVADQAKPYASDPYVDEEWRLRDHAWYRDEPLQTTRGDAAIKREIERELYWSPFVTADDVEVTVEDGVAVLSGRVDSWSEYNAASANAYESGVVDVENNLVVE